MTVTGRAPARRPGLRGERSAERRQVHAGECTGGAGRGDRLGDSRHDARRAGGARGAGGVPVTLVDTAGLRESADPIEAEGVRRALARAEEADLVIRVSDPDHGLPDDPGLVVMNKSDLGGACVGGGLPVSALTGEGMVALRERLGDEARRLTESSGPPPLTRARHRAALQDAVGRLVAAEHAGLSELRAEDVRFAVRALGRITGEVGVEDVLDRIFRQFCIGK